MTVMSDSKKQRRLLLEWMSASPLLALPGVPWTQDAATGLREKPLSGFQVTTAGAAGDSEQSTEAIYSLRRSGTRPESRGVARSVGTASSL